MKSLLDYNEYRCCYICGSTQDLENHHIFGGANRKKSGKYGLTVTLCHNCHNEPPNGIHFNAVNNHNLKSLAQKAAMEIYGWSTEDFINIFGKNYIWE